MEVSDTDSQILHIIGKVLCHTFGQGRDQDFIFLFNFLIYFCYKIIDLSFDRTHLHLRIKKPCRTDDLLCTEKLMVIFIFSRCRRYKHYLVKLVLEFIKAQWAVILGRWKSEAVIHQCLFTALITGIHTANLGNCLMGLIYNK